MRRWDWVGFDDLGALSQPGDSVKGASAWAVLGKSDWQGIRAIFGLEKGSRGQGHAHISLTARTRLVLVLFAADNKGIETSQESVG